MSKGNPNPKTDHLVATQFRKGDGRNRSHPEETKRALRERKDILYYIKDFENYEIEELEETAKSINAGKKAGLSAGYYVALQLWIKLLKGDQNALNDYLDRKYGRPTQQINSNVDLNVDSKKETIEELKKLIDSADE